MPKGPLRDVSIAAFARGLVSQNAGAALVRAQEIEEQNLRASTVAVLEQIQPQAAEGEEPDAGEAEEDPATGTEGEAEELAAHVEEGDPTEEPAPEEGQVDPAEAPDVPEPEGDPE
jgi:hypothetical protein